jgi:3-oxoadipyl-CoA thiolase
MREVWIVEAVRTPVGRHAGGLSGMRTDDLAAAAIAQAVERPSLDPSEIEEVFLGCSNQAGEDNRDVARMSALLAGFPLEVGGVTVNRLCGSGLEAIVQAARAVRVGDADVCVAGGVESMSRAPLVMAKDTKPFRRGERHLHDTALGWRFVNPKMEEMGHTDALGITAENLVEEYGITRSQQDSFALASHRKACMAIDENRFAKEIAPVETPTGVVKADEGPRRDTSMDKLASLSPAFKQGGSVTAGNSSPLSDGAAALVVTSRDYAEANGLALRARIVAMGSAGVAPRIMGIGPVPATAKAMSRAGASLGDMDVIELNEAFAGQVLAVLREWDVDAEDPRLNPNGGAIALGHPIGCSGARMVTTLVHHMEATDARRALATMCVGVGQGISLILDRGD